MNQTFPLRGCFVTGTDTEIGKTCVSAALLHWCAAQGWRSAGFKPVAAGTQLIDGQRVNDDVRALRDAGSVRLTDDEVGPLQFEAACAPHIAAALENRAIDGPALVQQARLLTQRADVLVVEGVGGFCVPLNQAWDTADLAQALGLPVILVVGLRLGCINHALLTAEAIQRRGLKLAGWIGNTVDPAMIQAPATLATLQHEFTRRYQAPCLGQVPRLSAPDPAQVAAHLDGAALATLLGPRPLVPHQPQSAGRSAF
ncbi:MAG: dethiobiotin synthase [Pseudomonadota bacterium]|nr:dethiobiotin synthase [Pseudomonadota bacterium]